MIGIVLKFIPALTLGLIMSIGTLFATSEIGDFYEVNCGACLQLTPDEKLEGKGFPLKYWVEESSTYKTEGLDSYNYIESNINKDAFIINWAIWSVVAFITLFVLKRVRNLAGNLVLFAVITGMALIYFGIIVVA